MWKEPFDFPALVGSIGMHASHPRPIDALCFPSKGKVNYLLDQSRVETLYYTLASLFCEIINTEIIRCVEYGRHVLKHFPLVSL